MVSPIRPIVTPANPKTIDYNCAKAELFLTARVDLTTIAQSIPASRLSGRGRKLPAIEHCGFESGEVAQVEPVGRRGYLKANWRLR
jgi:hypothetical protein